MDNVRDLRYAEIIGDIRKAIFSGLSRCKQQQQISYSGSGSGSNEGMTSLIGSQKKASPEKPVIVNEDHHPVRKLIEKKNSMDTENVGGVTYVVDRGSASSMMLTMQEYKVFHASV